MRLLWSGLYNRDYWQRWNERFGFVGITGDAAPRIWVHAVSVGEVQAAIPLIQSLCNEYPEHELLVTTVTPTGSTVVQQRFGHSRQILHAYLPYDLPGAISRFLDRIKPVLLIVIETELWPNLYNQCHARGVAILLANARVSDKSFRGYRKISRFTSQVLENINRIAAASEDDAERLVTLGADRRRITVTGNVKYDIVIPDTINEQAGAIKSDKFHDRMVWLAASTHEGEEGLILRAHRDIAAKFPGSVLVLAPRHPERSAGVAGMSEGFGYNTLRRTQLNDTAGLGDVGLQVLIIDTLGELLLYYAMADVAFVGGSLLPAYGGHNVLEPAVLGVPVITGKYTSNFSEIIDLLCAKHACYQVDDADQLAQKVVLLFSDPGLRKSMGATARALVRENQGSTGRILAIVSDLLPAGTTRRVISE